MRPGEQESNQVPDITAFCSLSPGSLLKSRLAPSIHHRARLGSYAKHCYGWSVSEGTGFETAGSQRSVRPSRKACRLLHESGQISLTQRPLHGAEHLIEFRQRRHLIAEPLVPQRPQPCFLCADCLGQAFAWLTSRLQLLPHSIGKRAKIDSFV